MQRLPDVLVIEFRKLLVSLGGIRVERGDFNHPPDSQAHSAQTGLAIEMLGIRGDAVEKDHGDIIGREKRL